MHLHTQLWGAETEARASRVLGKHSRDCHIPSSEDLFCLVVGEGVVHHLKETMEEEQLRAATGASDALHLRESENRARTRGRASRNPRVHPFKWKFLVVFYDADGCFLEARPTGGHVISEENIKTQPTVTGTCIASWAILL